MQNKVENKKIPASEWVEMMMPLLLTGYEVKLYPRGISMFPFLLSDRDCAVMKAAQSGQLRRRDIVLYESRKGVFLLHRIHHSRDGGFYMIGDHETEIEGPIRPEQIRAVAVRVIRNKKEINCSGFGWNALSEIWLWLRVFRPLICGIRVKIWAMFHRGRSTGGL